MERRVLGFIEALRLRGVPISPAESIDSLGALEQVGWERREQFRTALASTLIKRQRDAAIFDEIFPLYWQSLAMPESNGALPEDMRHQLQEMLNEAAPGGGDAADMLAMLLMGETGESESMIQQASGQGGMSEITSYMQIGMYARRLYNQFDWEAIEAALEQLLSRLEQEGWSEEQLEEVREAFARGKAAFRDRTRQYAARERARNAETWRRERIDDLARRPLSQLDEAELAQVRELVYQLAKRLRNKLSLRERHAKPGRLDVRRTLRRNYQHGGVPFELVQRRRKREKVELMVLCDVSSSVERVSRFMLQFVYTIQDCLAKVRSFVFVDEMGEVTDFFREADVTEGVKLALSAADISYNARSDFGSLFEDFCERYLGDVGYRTYILIIGDARNNRNPAHAEALERMAERAKGIIWLNPETQPFWDTGDSVMGEYLPFCKEARVCRNLADLEEAVASLLL